MFKKLLQIAFPLLSLHAQDGLPNPSTRPVTQPRTVEVFAKGIYWHTGETVDWAFTLSRGPNSLQASYKTFSFNWAPGFCVGLGYNMIHDKWDSQASYTWFQSKASDQTSGTVTPAFMASRLSLLEPFSTGKATLNLHYNIFDWDLGRSFLISNGLALRPSIGLKGGWIQQTILSKWTIPNFLGLGILFQASEKLKHSFEGVGPKGGISGKWLFGNIQEHAFSFIGQFETGFLFGHWSIQDHFIDSFSTKISVKTSKRNFGSIVFHSFLGLGWDCNFDRDQSHFGLQIGYEIQDWLNQFQIFSDASGSQNNDLILQGLTGSLNVDF